MAAMAAPKNGPVKKLTIKTLQKKPSDGGAATAPDVLETSWSTLREFIHAVQQLRHTEHSFQELYAAVESLVLAKHGATLYQRVCSEISAHVDSVVGTMKTGGSAASSILADPGSYVSLVTRAWTEFCAQLVMIRNVFLYLDRAHVRDTAGARPLWDQGVFAFREALLANPHTTLSRISSSIISLVTRERKGETVDRPSLSVATRMLTALRLYTSHLEPLLLSSTRDFYGTEGSERMGSLPAPEYCLYVDQRLREEQDRVLSCLDASSLRPVIAGVEGRLISDHATTLLDRGFGPLMDASRTDDLRRMCVLLSRVDRVDEMRKCFADYVKRRGAALVAEESEEKDKRLIDDLLQFRQGTAALVLHAFGGHEGFASALKSAVELAVNSRDNRPAELLAKYVDTVMRQGSKAIRAGASGGGAAGGAGASSSSSSLASSALTGGGGAGSSGNSSSGGGGGGGAGGDVDALLDELMMLFRCLHGKDVFEAFYKKDLAKRLLLHKSASSDSEKSFVSKLKTECGSAFTSKLEGMFKDSDLSSELMAQFLASKFNYRNGGGEGGAAASSSSSSALVAGGGSLPELDVHVLTASYWPPYTPAPAIVPADLQPCLTAFDAFYQAKYSKGRRLVWQHQLGHCIVRAVFPSGRKELEVSFFQLLVLYLFNAADALPFPRIKELTGIEDGELRRTLQSLALGKARVLRKEPKGKEVEDGDVFTWNREFSDPLIRIRINTIQAKETKAEADATHEKVMQDRGYQVDAAIVRIMKSRKTLAHQQLVSEVFGQLRFAAKGPDVKKRIESLIERDYLERDEADPNTYHYLA